MPLIPTTVPLSILQLTVRLASMVARVRELSREVQDARSPVARREWLAARLLEVDAHPLSRASTSA